MKIVDGKEVYEKSDFDNHAFYGLVGGIFGAGYGIAANEPPEIITLFWVIGAAVWVIKYLTVLLIDFINNML